MSAQTIMALSDDVNCLVRVFWNRLHIQQDADPYPRDIKNEITTRDHELPLNRQGGGAHFSTMVEVE